VSAEHGKPAVGLDHCFGDSRFMEPVAKVAAARWRGIAATAVELKERSLSPASLRKKCGADQLTAGLQAAHELSHGWLRVPIAAGLQGVWVNRSWQPRPSHRPDLVEVTTLSDLPAALGSMV
jgi:hypothetical protein